MSEALLSWYVPLLWEDQNMTHRHSKVPFHPTLSCHVNSKHTTHPIIVYSLRQLRIPGMQIDQPLLGGLVNHITRQLKPVNELFERLLRDASILDEGDHQFSSPQGQGKKAVSRGV